MFISLDYSKKNTTPCTSILSTSMSRNDRTKSIFIQSVFTKQYNERKTTKSKENYLFKNSGNLLSVLKLLKTRIAIYHIIL